MVPRLAVLACALALAGPAASQEADPLYWTRNVDSKVVPTCEGERSGVPVKVANRSMGDWLLITGIATCTDTGSAYRYRFEFLKVAVNPRSRDRVTREVLNFDWIGLAAFAEGQGSTEWLYDEAVPLRGALPRSSSETIAFGGMAFEVPKPVMGRATRFMFHLVARGVNFGFGAL